MKKQQLTQEVVLKKFFEYSTILPTLKQCHWYPSFGDLISDLRGRFTAHNIFISASRTPNRATNPTVDYMVKYHIRQ